MQGTQDCQTILNKNKAEQEQSCNFKTNYKVIVNKTEWYQHENRHTEMGNKIKSPKIKLHLWLNDFLQRC